MSIQFENPMDERTAALLRKTFGEPVAEDSRTMLFDKLSELDHKKCSEIANLEGQPMKIELNSRGERKMVAGTEYEVTPQGWRKVAEPG